MCSQCVSSADALVLPSIGFQHRGQPTGVDIALNDSHVSNPHAAFEFTSDPGDEQAPCRCLVQDLCSSNGTIVDGALLKSKKKRKKNLVAGSTRGVELTSSVSTVEVWLNGPCTHLRALQAFCMYSCCWLTQSSMWHLLACIAQKSEQKSFD